LSCLNLGSNQLGDEGAGRLAEVLPQCPALRLLWLRNNWIGGQGAGRYNKQLSSRLARTKISNFRY
jgi:Ran GTPase-activating protein (RanGAP) involved in mRNA processing and transport